MRMIVRHPLARRLIEAVLTLFGVAVLVFVTLLTLVSRYAHYNPNAEGFTHFFEDPGLNLQQMLFPALVLGFGLAAPIMRTARSALLEVQTQDFVRTARGKGVAPMRLRVRHV